MDQYVSNRPQQKRSFFYNCGFIFLFLLALCSVFSPLRALSFFNEIWALCIVGWFLCTFLENPKFLLIPDRYRAITFFYVSYTIGVAYLAGNGIIGNRFIELSQLPLFYFAYLKNKQVGRNRDNLLIVKLIAPFVVITSIITISAYAINPYISRGLKDAQGGAEDALASGIGGYEFVYFLVIVFAILLYFVFNKITVLPRKYKAAGVGLLLLFAINIIMSNYSTAFLLLTLAIFMRLLLNKIKVTTLLFYTIGALIFGFFAKDIALMIIEFFISQFGETMNAKRMIEIKSIIQGGQGGNSVDARADAFSESLKVFAEHPFFGRIMQPLNFNVHGEVIGFGQHSQVLDTFAMYGFGIGLLQLYVYLQPMISRMKLKKGMISGFSLTVLVVFLTLISINNATPSIGFAALFIYPTLYDWYIEKDKK